MKGIVCPNCKAEDEMDIGSVGANLEMPMVCKACGAKVKFENGGNIYFTVATILILGIVARRYLLEDGLPLLVSLGLFALAIVCLYLGTTKKELVLDNSN